ncbi:hypothetical protein TWF103_007009, partial [Orbilia oligospora]
MSSISSLSEISSTALQELETEVNMARSFATARARAMYQEKHGRAAPGTTVALREIRKYQKFTGLLIPRRPFRRLIREVTHGIVSGSYWAENDPRWTKEGMEAVQEAAEAWLTNMFAN